MGMCEVLEAGKMELDTKIYCQAKAEADASMGQRQRMFSVEDVM